MFKSFAQSTSSSESDSSVANRSRDTCNLATGRRACIGRTDSSRTAFSAGSQIIQSIVNLPSSRRHPQWDPGDNPEDSYTNMLPRSLVGHNTCEKCPCMTCAVAGLVVIHFSWYRRDGSEAKVLSSTATM